MRVARSLAIGLTLIIAASGCTTSEPSLKEATAELQKDTHLLETDDVFKNPLKKLHIIQRPDKDIPCAKDKFRRVLRATADYERVDEPLENHLDLAETLMENTLAQKLKYKLDFDLSQTDAEDGRFIYGAKENPEIRVTVYVGSEAPTWRLHAMTACLPR
ncbi:hypothetical protein ABT340_16075 [Streptosporangium sp. NPDC000239]|uniref:hypothetical protein n=1 Tax=Streptosporangium sp. NPDC000239 TaxID=3154248 RepID=UPI00332B5DE4